MANRVVIITALVSISLLAVACDEQKPNKKAAMNFFRKYGYVSAFSDNLDDQSLKIKVKTMQAYAGLPPTGELNDATLKQMGKDRCGIRDPDLSDADTTGKRTKRYVLQGTAWSKNKLTWYLHNSGRSLTRDQVRTQLYTAFQLWSKASQLTFEEVSAAKEADIEVRFATFAHGDPYHFDGPGQILAHGFYPLNEKGLAGDVHFDDSETYSIGENDPTKKDFLWVATHEIGHALGIDHSRVQEALMFAWYRGYKPNFDLQQDDIDALQALYGPPRIATTPPPSTTTPTTPTTKPTTPTTKPTTPTTTQPPTTKPAAPTAPPQDNRPNCPPSIDALFHLSKYSQYDFIVSGDKMWLSRNGKLVRSSLSISSYFKEIKEPVDAAYMREDGATVFFTGRNFYVYNSLTYESGPTDISVLGLPSYVHRVSAAQVWLGNGLRYIYYEDRYWRQVFNKNTRKFDLKGPFSLTYAWRGVPIGITACGPFEKKKTLFFKNNKYYELDNKTLRTRSGFPKSISELLNCKLVKDPANIELDFPMIGSLKASHQGRYREQDIPRERLSFVKESLA